MKKLHKNLIGFIMIAVGSYLIYFANRAMGEISEAKDFIENFTDFFAKNSMWNPLVTFFGGTAYEEASKHDTTVLALLISGIILILGGVFILLQRRSRSNTKQ